MRLGSAPWRRSMNSQLIRKRVQNKKCETRAELSQYIGMTIQRRFLRVAKTNLHAIYIVVLLCAFGTFLVVRLPSIPFANDGNCDPWYIFVALFYRFPDFLHWLSYSRQVARLPEILPGYFATQVLSGVTPDYVLFFCYYLTSSVLLYRAVHLLIDRQVAVIATIFFAAHPLIIANYSITLDGPAIAYDVIALYFVAASITAKKRSRSNLLMFVSGVVTGIAAHAHLGVAAFAAVNYVVYVTYECLQRRSIVQLVSTVAVALLA